MAVVATQRATTAKYFFIKIALTLVGMKSSAAFLKEKKTIEEQSNEFK